MQQLKLANDLFPGFASGKKRMTIRKGRRDIQLAELEFESTDEVNGAFLKQQVFVTRVVYVRACDVTSEEARTDGFDDNVDMVERMKRFYPAMDFSDELTLVYFEIE